MVGNKQNLITDYIQHVSIDEIKRKYKTSWETISKICTEVGVWNQEERLSYQQAKSSYNQRNVKNNPFEDLDNRDVQYWLGMLATDGALSNNRITLSLDSKDDQHIMKFKSFINCNLPVKYIRNKKYNSSMCAFQFRSKPVFDYLHSIGITVNKSFTLDLKIPITWDLLRGIIDGDGSITIFKSKKGKSFCAIDISTVSKKFAFQLHDFINDNNINCKLYFYGNQYIITVRNFTNCKMLVEKLYNNADTYLERKYLKAQLISNYKLKTDSKFREPALGILSEIYIDDEEN